MLGTIFDYLFNIRNKTHIEHSIGLVHHKYFDIIEVNSTALDMIQ